MDNIYVILLYYLMSGRGNFSSSWGKFSVFNNFFTIFTNFIQPVSPPRRTHANYTMKLKFLQLRNVAMPHRDGHRAFNDDVAVNASGLLAPIQTDFIDSYCVSVSSSFASILVGIAYCTESQIETHSSKTHLIPSDYVGFPLTGSIMFCVAPWALQI